MKRKIYKQLIVWKNSIGRKPLIIRGARQVGKSYILNDFGKNEFKNYHIFDFEKNKNQLMQVFEKSLEPQTIIKNLSLLLNKNISIKEDLIVFDEIQNCPRALASLKYFNENLSAAVCAAGSLLGITLSEESFPVGQVTFLDMFPMSFEEFLFQYNNDMLLEAFEEGIKNKMLPVIAHQKLWEILKEYYIVGGMPEAVKTFQYYMDDKLTGFSKAREVQQNLLLTYMSDFNKHSGKINSLHISSVFENVPRQLAQNGDYSVKRFRFKDAIRGKYRSSDFDGPINWLERAGLIHKVFPCRAIKIPLKSFTQDNIFKLYIFDTGLLNCMLEISPQVLILQDYGTIKGFIAENLAVCEMKSSGEKNLYSWEHRNSEIEFIMNKKEKIIPIEVKSGRLTRAKSLQQYRQMYSPLTEIIVSSGNLEFKDNGAIYCPLYYLGKLIENIDSVID